MRRTLALTLVLFVAGLDGLFAQSDKVSQDAYLWQRYYFNGLLTDRWALSVEAEHRNLLPSWRSSQTLLPRLAAHYQFNQQMQAGLGFAHFLNYGIADGANPTTLDRSELRLHQEWKYQQPFTRFRIGHRLRVEERFYVPYTNTEKALESASVTYGFRFRYQLGLRLQLTPQVQRTHVFLKLHDELLLQASEAKPDQLFEANRFYGGLELRFSEAWALEAGYLTWIELRVANRSYTYFVPHILRVTLHHSLDLRKKHS